LLVAGYQTADNSAESPAAYALCYKCHERTRILTESSPFKYHLKHVSEEKTPCATCHDSHGISSVQGTTSANRNLINFNVSIVRPDPATGRLEYQSSGSGTGKCYLMCHGKAHSPLSY
jgi:hypothetical protein